MLYTHRTPLVLFSYSPPPPPAVLQVPLFDPSMEPWMVGQSPYVCNAPKVAFVEAAHPTPTPDVFRVYFGGADMVTGSALVHIGKVAGMKCDGSMPPGIEYS